MQEPDGNLLTRFATHRDEAAFKTLTDRYLGLIYHVALRRTGNSHLAEEISQNVLCAVVRKAAGLARHPDRLPAWLHRATLFESSKAMRSEASHQRRKQLGHPDDIPATDSGDSAWDAALPVLDLALDRLPDSDRGVVLRHYFEGKSFHQIGGEVSRPAATVQKQCRRALDKLARILRGKGVTLSAAALASGLFTQSAKAAPPALLKSAAAKALAGAASHSTTSLTLFMAMKSKAALPLALLLLVSPLALQQAAISRTAAHNDCLREALGSSEAATRRTSSTAGTRTVSTGNGRITIGVLQRAHQEASRSALKRIEFEEMLAALDAGELEALIPQAAALPVIREEKLNLFSYLIGTLAALDPGKAVRAACAVDLGRQSIENSGVHRAFHLWASADPEEAVAWLADWSARNPDESGHDLLPLQGAAAAALILADSPRVREILTGQDHVNPGYVLRDAISQLRSTPAVENADAAVASFSKFLPWIREFIPENRSSESGFLDRAQMIDRLLFDVGLGSLPSASPVPGKILDEVDLLPAERRIIAGSHAQRMLASLCDGDRRPDRAEVETAARDWLATHFPEAADEVFAESMSVVMERARREIGEATRDLASRETVRDSDLIERLGRYDFSGFPEFLPQAIDLARRIKDPAKRAETIEQLQSPAR
jgi:RNA polymerase sigma factor (sigma-70 family)